MPQPAAGAGTRCAEAGHGEDAPHAESPWALVARLLNFALLVGGLVYLLRGPLSQHLATRTQQIRGDLVAARETTARATAQIAEIDRKLAALPAELEALRAQGAEEIAAEEARIRQQADAERQRLLDQTRRDVDLQVRLARRALANHAADLAVALAKDRITATIRDEDQAHLADRYVAQVKDIHG